MNDEFDDIITQYKDSENIFPKTLGSSLKTRICKKDNLSPSHTTYNSPIKTMKLERHKFLAKNSVQKENFVMNSLNNNIDSNQKKDIGNIKTKYSFDFISPERISLTDSVVKTNRELPGLNYQSYNERKSDISLIEGSSGHISAADLAYKIELLGQNLSRTTSDIALDEDKLLKKRVYINNQLSESLNPNDLYLSILQTHSKLRAEIRQLKWRKFYRRIISLVVFLIVFILIYRLGIFEPVNVQVCRFLENPPFFLNINNQKTFLDLLQTIFHFFTNYFEKII